MDCIIWFEGNNDYNTQCNIHVIIIMYIILRSGGYFKLMVHISWSTMNKDWEMYDVHIS